MAETINNSKATGSTLRSAKLAAFTLTVITAALLFAGLLRRAESSLTGSAKNARRK